MSDKLFHLGDGYVLRAYHENDDTNDDLMSVHLIQGDVSVSQIYTKDVDKLIKWLLGKRPEFGNDTGVYRDERGGVGLE